MRVDMKIVTWNMGRRRGAWDYLVTVINPVYALLQETLRPPGPPDRWCWAPVGEHSLKHGKAGRYAWGSAVWSRDHDLQEVTIGEHEGWVEAARSVDSNAFLLISIHVELDRQGRSIPMLHRILSGLTPTLEQASTDLILGGDLNADVGFDQKDGTRRHAIAFERIEDFGLWHCNRLIPAARRRTFRPQSVMDDHLFVGRSMMSRVLSCHVLANEDVPSDHFPVVLELEPG